MKSKKIIVCYIILSIFFILIGCVRKTNNDSEIKIEKKLSLEDIKEGYTDSEIVSITMYLEDYVLVESHQDTFANRFDFYNLKTGDIDILPVGPNYAKLEKIENENYIIFLADGTSHINTEKRFPFIIECRRNKENIDYEGDFMANYIDKYFDINEMTKFGKKENEVICDVKVTLKGLEILFKPMEGKETEFYAADTTIPPTEILYIKEKNQLAVKFVKTQISEEIEKLGYEIRENNYYLKSLQLYEEKDYSVVIIKLKDTARSYCAYIERIEDCGLPFLKIRFSERKDN